MAFKFCVCVCVCFTILILGKMVKVISPKTGVELLELERMCENREYKNPGLQDTDNIGCGQGCRTKWPFNVGCRFFTILRSSFPISVGNVNILMRFAGLNTSSAMISNGHWPPEYSWFS